jgi:hypothetical protein
MTASMIPDVPDVLQRINLVLRIWAGRVETGKAINDKTRGGPNTSIIRTQKMQQFGTRAADPVYEAGMVASVIIKRKRGENFSFEGVPDGTRLAKLKTL